MDEFEQKRFLTVLTGIADYYNKELSTGVVGLYWQGLRQYDMEAVEKALWAHTQNPDTGQWMPKIADVIKMLQGRTTDQSAIAWAKVDSAVRHVGTYADVVFDDAITHRVLADMGGWAQLGTKNDDEWPFVAREFENRYRGYRLRNETPDYPPVLIGTANAHNAREGFARQPPILIGVEAKARRVMAAGTTGPLIGIRSSGTMIDSVPKQIQKAA